MGVTSPFCITNTKITMSSKQSLFFILTGKSYHPYYAGTISYFFSLSLPSAPLLPIHCFPSTALPLTTILYPCDSHDTFVALHLNFRSFVSRSSSPFPFFLLLCFALLCLHFSPYLPLAALLLPPPSFPAARLKQAEVLVGTATAPDGGGGDAAREVFKVWPQSCA